MIRFVCASALFAAALVLNGCSSTPQLQTRSYQLQRPATEEALIKSALDDEFARVKPEDMGAVVEKNGGTVKALQITPDNTAIVRTTPRTHAAIRKALAESRKDSAAAPAGT